MRILLVNKFLYPKGGAETYIFKLGDILREHEHEVQYFGMADERNTVGNHAGAYVSPADFSQGVRKNILAPFRIIYSAETRRKIQEVLMDFQPEVVHLNNIQFHLTPSVILEVNKYRKQTGRKVKIIYTAHDYQLICPSHGLFDTQMNICEKCLDGNYTHCLRTRCVKNSRLKSFLGMLDAYVWKYSRAYQYIDKIVCPSEFLKGKLDGQRRFADKTVTLHNFVSQENTEEAIKENYVLEFGHLCRDKGTLTLLEVCKRMPDVKFVFAGYGEAVQEIERIPNADYVGFQTGLKLKELIQKALCSVYPSEWYENCPFSVIESQMYLTPVIASRMGGIPELVQEGKTGLLFEAGNVDDLEKNLRQVLETPGFLSEMTKNCKNAVFESAETYYKKLMEIYGGVA